MDMRYSVLYLLIPSGEVGQGLECVLGPALGYEPDGTLRGPQGHHQDWDKTPSDGHPGDGPPVKVRSLGVNHHHSCQHTVVL